MTDKSQYQLLYWFQRHNVYSHARLADASSSHCGKVSYQATRELWACKDANVPGVPITTTCLDTDQ